MGFIAKHYFFVANLLIKCFAVGCFDRYSYFNFALFEKCLRSFYGPILIICFIRFHFDTYTNCFDRLSFANLPENFGILESLLFFNFVNYHFEY